MSEVKKIDWKSIDWNAVSTSIALEIASREREKLQRFRAYWKYQLFTPLHIKIWHKITFRKTPKL